MKNLIKYGFIAVVSCFLLSCGSDKEEEKIYKYEFRTGSDFSMKFFADKYTEDSTFYYIDDNNSLLKVYKNQILYIVVNKNCN